MPEINLIDIPDTQVIGIRKTGRYEEISQMIMKLAIYATEKGIGIVGPPIYVGHEMSPEAAKKAAAEGNADLEVAFPVIQKGSDSGEFKFYTLPGGKMAKITHKGPYSTVEPSYAALFAWLGQNQKQITGPIRETYVNDPRTTPESELITEIAAPIG